jgi:hypothetical protein
MVSNIERTFIILIVYHGSFPYPLYSSPPKCFPTWLYIYPNAERCIFESMTRGQINSFPPSYY